MFEHAMLREIYEQPEAIARTLARYVEHGVLREAVFGETADTLMALREAIQRGHPTLALTNVAESSMAREATVSLPTVAGVEKAIPATKSFTTQLVVLRLLSLLAAEARKQISVQELAKQ